MKTKNRRNIVFLLASTLLMLAHPAQATNYWWDSNDITAGFGSAAGTWGTSAFWTTSSAGTATATAAVTTSSDTVNFGTATLNYSNGAVGIAAGGVTVNSIVYGAGQTTSINLGTTGNALTLAGTTPAITVNNPSVAQTISSTVSGGAGLTKAGVGTLILSGTNAYTGVTTITGGTLTVSSLANAGSNSNIGTFSTAGATGLILQGGTLNYTGGSTTTDRGFTSTGTASSTITVGTGVSLNLGASVRTDTINSGNGLIFTSGAGSSVTISSLTISSGANTDFNVTAANTNVTFQTLNVTGSVVIANRGTGLLNVGNLVGSGSSGWFSNLNITGAISGYTGTIYLGNDVTLTGLSGFNAPIVLQQTGTYTFNSIKNVNGGASALGNPTTVANGTITAGNGTNTPTFKYTGTGDTTDRVIDLKSSTGTVTLSQSGTGLLKFTSNLTASGGGSKTLVLTGSTSGTGELAGTIVNNSVANITSVTKTGTGTWTLSGTNSYTGATTVSGGTLALGANNVLPDVSAVSIGNATLNAATYTDIAGTLAVTGTATINMGSSGAALAFADSSAVAWTGTLNITGAYSATSLRFGTTGAGLSASQLAQISVNGSGLNGYTLNSSGYLVAVGLPPDTTPPTPSPMTWASVPAAASSTSITMTATTATDPSGVEYDFTCTAGGGHDSGWQSSTTYTDTGLSPSTSYTYTVTARDKSTAQNTTLASAPASATTSAAPLYTVWNVQIASPPSNQIATTDNFIGAAPENTVNSTWNHVASQPQSGMVLMKSDGAATGVSLDLTADGTRQPGTQNLLSGYKIFNSYFGGAGHVVNMTLKGLSMTNSYDLVMYSDWWWKNGDSYPVSQTSGTGMTGTIYINCDRSETTGTVAGLEQDTNPADVPSGAGNVGNWYRIKGLTPTLNGELGFLLGNGANAPFNGFQLIATPLAPRADMLSLSLASNPPSIRDATFSGTNVTLTVPYGTNVTNVAPTYTLWPGATCVPASGTARNFTTPQTYTVTSSDSLVTKTYTVTVVVAPPLPEFTLTAPATWDGRTTVTVQPNITNLALLQATGGTNFTYQWSMGGVAVTSQITPGVLTLTRSQGSGMLAVTLTMANGTEGVTHTANINIQEPATDPWVERTPLPNEKPVNGQFFARNPFTNLGTVFYYGTQIGTPASVYLKVYKTPAGGSETLDATYRQGLVSGAYAFSAPLQAGLLTYRVVYGTTTGGNDTDAATVTGLVCGDAYIIEGQSNAQATNNEEPQVDTSYPWIWTYDASLGWGPAYAKPTSPNWGSLIGFWGMKLAQSIVADQQMPVCIINGAVGGTRIDQHQPNPVDRTVGAGTYDIYANLLNRVIAARLNNGIRGVFWHQGESDCSNFGPITDYDYTAYQQNFLNMSAAWKQDYPNLQRYIIYQVMPSPCGIGPKGDQLREVQRNLPRLYSKMSILTTLAIAGYEGCHYSKAGYESMASRMAPVVYRDFYGMVPAGPVTPPNLNLAYFTSSSRTAITLEFDQPVNWSSFSLPNYYVNKVANLVTSGSASGNTVTLQLSGAAAANATIDYLEDAYWNPSEAVTSLLYGTNAIPALTFADVPVAALSPYDAWAAAKNLSGGAAAGDADPDHDGVQNALEFVLGGEPNPSTSGSNSANLLPISSRNDAGDFVFTFRRKTASAGAVSLAFQWSTSLPFPAQNSVMIGTSGSTTDGINVTVSSVDSATDQIVITVPAAKASAGKLFGRLQATLP